MNKTAELFRQCVAEIPESVNKELNLSFAISDKIDAILTEKGMTQKELAKLMGKNEAEVSRWLGGTHNFTIFTLVKISNALGVDIITVA